MNGNESTRPIALIADDDDLVRLMLTEAVAQAGLEAVAASDGVTALAIGWRTPFAVAMLDVEMPKLDGFAVCSALRQVEHARHAPIVMITGHDDAVSVDRAYQVGATDFMPKPLNWPLIPHRLRYLLRNADSLRALHRSDAENRTLLESIPDRIHVLDSAGRVRRVLRAPAAPAPEHASLSDLLPLDQVATAHANVAATAVDGVPRSQEYAESDQAASTRHYDIRYFRCGEGEVMAMRQDITLRRRQEQRILELAYFDSLTGLQNRASFVERAQARLESLATDDLHAAVLHIDLNGFKRVNATFGHDIGDRVLRAVAARLRQCLEEDPGCGLLEMARFGGDEFVMLVRDDSESAGKLAVADRINAAFAEPLVVEGRDLFVQPSIGIAAYPAHGSDVRSLLKNADSAMHVAKGTGTAGRSVYTEQMSARAQAWLTLDTHLRRAIRREMFELHYQPQYGVADGALRGAEALLRWFDPELGEVPPGRFVPLAEESGLILELGAWVARAACRQLRHWLDQGRALQLAINVSGKEFMHGDPAGQLRAAMQECEIDPGSIEIEITESILISDSAQIQKGLADLRALGCRIALDDFGTGYSSLAYLRRFPPDSLKIDRCFIRNVHRDPGDAAVVDAILALAQSLRMEVVAEGVECAEQLEWLRARGCSLAQGYHLGRPMPAPRLEALVPANVLSRDKVPMAG
jgi:diguanylate cyclase (GGDEF)-like protein